MEQTDEDLVGGVIRGEQEAFAVMFKRYRLDVCRHLLGIIRDDAAADDLTQEVFLRLWRRAQQWRGEATLRSWLLRISVLSFGKIGTLAPIGAATATYPF